MRTRRTLIASAVAATAAFTLTVPLAQGATAENGATAGSSPASAPSFVDGMAQPVFAAGADGWVFEEGWAEAPVDSDGDGQNDLVHFDITRPRGTGAGLQVPVVMEASPYYAGGNDTVNHQIEHPLYDPDVPGSGWQGDATPPAAATGSGQQAGRSSATSGGTSSVAGMVAAARAEAQADPGAKASPDAISGSLINTWVPRGFAVMHVESIGTGESQGCPTIGGPEETAGVKSVIDWLNGRATARDAGGAKMVPTWTSGKVAMMGTSYNGTLPNAVASTGVEGLEAINPVSAIDSWYDYYRSEGAVLAPGGYQGEDEDVLFDYVYTRADQEICKPVRERLVRGMDRETGDYNAFWNARNYLKDADKVTAATFVVHGLRDNNVKTKQAAQWYDAVAKNGVPHRIYWTQGGHGGAAPADDLNRWFSRFLYGVANGAEDEPHAIVQREDRTDVRYAEWPVPGSASVRVGLTAPGDAQTGGLKIGPSGTSPAYTSFTDVPDQTVGSLAAAPSTEHGLVFTSAALGQAVHLSGVPVADLRFTTGQGAANVTVGLVDLAPDGTVSRVITQGWRDPQNRSGLWNTKRVEPDTAYRMPVTLQANDYVFAAGHRIGVVLMQSEADYTILPPAGNVLSVDTARTVLNLPVVGGRSALKVAMGG